MMPLFLGDVAVTKLVDCNPSMADIDGDSNRNASGTMIRIVIAKKKKKFQMTFNMLTEAEKTAILEAVDPDDTGIVGYTMTYINEKGATVTGTFYSNEFTEEIVTWSTTDASKRRYNLSFPAVEF